MYYSTTYLNPRAHNFIMKQLFLLTLLLITSSGALGWSHSPIYGDSSCLFHIPLISDPNNSCVEYDLQNTASAGPYKISTPEHNYMIGLCGNISSSALPTQCNASGPAVAYWYNNTSCYALGTANNQSTYVVSVSTKHSALIKSGEGLICQ